MSSNMYRGTTHSTKFTDRRVALSLIGVFLGKLLTRGRLHLILPDGTRESFGPGGAEEVTVRLHDRRVALDIARDPKLAITRCNLSATGAPSRSRVVTWLNRNQRCRIHSVPLAVAGQYEAERPLSTASCWRPISTQSGHYAGRHRQAVRDCV